MDDLPYEEIPDYPEDFGAGNIVTRIIDGLGYRYYWATESLRPEDLQYRPAESSRTIDETMEHILGLSIVVLNTVEKKPTIRPVDELPTAFYERRRATLMNIKKASEAVMNATPEELSEMDVVFRRDETERRYPFWHILNGPIADAIYHVGQVVAFRRASGNPINPDISQFTGKKRN